MVSASQTSDVFISHAISDKEIARDVAHSLEAAGLSSFYLERAEPSQDISEAIWEALSESRALVAIVSPDTGANAMGMVEIGAATAWNKPVFVLIHGSLSSKLPIALQRYPAYPLSRLDEVVGAIRTGFEPLSDDDRKTLADVYSEHGTPVDQLSQSPTALRNVTADFNDRAKKQLSGERILSELLRLRKRGQLPRLTSKGLAN